MIRFENYSIDSGRNGTSFVNHITNEVRHFAPGDAEGDFFDLMDHIEENDWDEENEPYSVVLDRLWERTGS
jgi:hypothetical protein